MHARPYLAWGIFACAVLLLTACGQEAPYTPATISVTIAPAGNLTFVEGCTTSALENWLENTDFLAMEFVRTMTDNVSQPPDGVGPALQRMTELRNAFVAVPAPDDCAGELHRRISALMETGLSTYQAYANGETTQMQTVASEANATLADIRQQQAQLMQQLEQQFNAAQGQGGS